MPYMLALFVGGVSAIVAGSSLVNFLKTREKTGVRLRVGSHTVEYSEGMTEEEFEALLSKTLGNGEKKATRS